MESGRKLGKGEEKRNPMSVVPLPVMLLLNGAHGTEIVGRSVYGTGSRRQ